MTARRLAKLVLVGWLGGCVALTAARVPAWSSDLTVWGAAVRVVPHKPRAWVNYGDALRREGKIGAAGLVLRHARLVAAERSDPMEREQADAWASLSLVWVDLAEGFVLEAKAEAERLHRVYPTWPAAAHVCEALRCHTL